MGDWCLVIMSALVLFCLLDIFLKSSYTRHRSIISGKAQSCARWGAWHFLVGDGDRAEARAVRNRPCLALAIGFYDQCSPDGIMLWGHKSRYVLVVYFLKSIVFCSAGRLGRGPKR